MLTPIVKQILDKHHTLMLTPIVKQILDKPSANTNS